MKLWFRQVAKHFWIWIAIELIHKSVLGIYISEERNMFVAENFIHSLVSQYGKHTIYTDSGTWYPHACNFSTSKIQIIFTIREEYD